MAQSGTVITIGAICFGVVVGYITYRTLARVTAGASVSDIASVIAAVGGGAVTVLFDPQESDAFGWYAIGLLMGMALYLTISLAIRGKKETGVILGGDDPLPGGGN
jgi:hypothetical protein